MRKIQFFIIAGIFTFISGCGWSPSEEEKAIAEKECINLIAESMDIFTTIPEAAPKIFDTYTKNGKIVMEVGYKLREYQGANVPYSVRLCVVDLEKGTVALPSPFNSSEWRK